MLPDIFNFFQIPELWNFLRDLFLNEVTTLPNSSQNTSNYSEIVETYKKINPYTSDSVIAYSLKLIYLIWNSMKNGTTSTISFNNITQGINNRIFNSDEITDFESEMSKFLDTFRKKDPNFRLDLFLTTIYEDFLNYILILPYNQIMDAFSSSNNFYQFHQNITNYLRIHRIQLKGRYYTPSELAHFIVEKSLHKIKSKSTLKILDLCSGTGAFTLEILAKIYSDLLKSSPESSSIFIIQSIINNHLRTIDVDPIATYILRMRIILWISEYRLNSSQLENILRDIVKITKIGNIFDGKDYFQTKFDVIISNPPYISEKSNKRYIDLIIKERNSKFYKPRLDYYLHFFAFALENLKPMGRLGFIIPSYFTETQSATSIRKYLQDQSTHIYYYDFHDRILFLNAPGFHSCFIVCHMNSNKPLLTKFLQYYDNLQELPSKKIPYSELFLSDFDYMMKFIPKPMELNLKNHNKNLSMISQIRQGVVAGPDRIRRRHLSLLDNNEISNNQGVFVLTNQEVSELGLNKKESEFLLPFCYVRNLAGNFYNKNQQFTCQNQIIYLNQENFEENQCSNLLKHLEKFIPIMESRRENQLNKRKWYELHWPRTKKIFTVPRILAIRRTLIPRFIYTDVPFVTDLATNIIIPKNPKNCLKLYEFLITPRVTKWISYYAKHKGNMLQIDKTLLEKIPVPEFL